MKAHLIENGVVVNTIEVESLNDFPNLIEANEGAIGWLWNGSKLTAPPIVTPIPESVTMRQARLALLSRGLLANVDTAIASLASPQKEEAQIEWDYSNIVVRNREFVQMLGVALGLSSKQLDDLFIYASTL